MFRLNNLYSEHCVRCFAQQSDFRTSTSHEGSSDSESGDEFDAIKKNKFSDKHLQRSRKRIMDSSSDWSEDNVGSQRKPKPVKKPKIFDTDSNVSDEDTALSKQTPAKRSAVKKPRPSLKSNQSSCEGKLTSETITDKPSKEVLTTSATLKKKSDATPSKHVRLQKQKPILPLTSDSSSSSSSSDESDASHEATETKKTTPLSALTKGKPRPSSQSTPIDRTGSKAKRRESESNRPAAARKPQKGSLSLFNFVSDDSDSDGDIRVEKKSPCAARKVPTKFMDSGSSSDDYLFTDPPKSDLTNKCSDGGSGGAKKDVTTVREKKEDHTQKRSHSTSKPENKSYDKSKKAHNKSDLHSENASRLSDVVKSASTPKQGKSTTSFAVKHDGDGSVSWGTNPPRETLKKEFVEFNDDSNSQGTRDTDMLKAPSGDNKTELKGRISKHDKNKEKSGKKREKIQHRKDGKNRHSADSVPTKMESGKKDKVLSLKVPSVDDTDRRDESIKPDATEKRSDSAKHLSRELSEKNYNAFEYLDVAFENKYNDAFLKFAGVSEENIDSVSGKKISDASEKNIGGASESKIDGAPGKKIDNAFENKIDGASEKKIDGASEKLESASEKSFDGASQKKNDSARKLTPLDVPQKPIDGASEKKNVGTKHFTPQEECAGKPGTEAKPTKQKGHKLTNHDDVKKTDKVKRSSEADSVALDVKTEVTEKKSKSKKGRIASHGGSSERQSVAIEKDALQSDNIFEKLQYSCPAETPSDTQPSLTPGKDKITPSVEMSLVEGPVLSETSVAVEAILTPAPVAKSCGEKLERLSPRVPTTLPASVSRGLEEVPDKGTAPAVVGSGGQSTDDHSVLAEVKTESTGVCDAENTMTAPEKPTRKVEEKPPRKDQSLLDSIAVESCLNQPFMKARSDGSSKKDRGASPTCANAQLDGSACNQTKEASDSDNNADVETSEQGIPDLETEAAVLGILPTSDTEYGYWSGADNFDMSGQVSIGYGGRDVKKIALQSSLYETPEHEATTPETEDGSSLFISEDIATPSETVKPEKEPLQHSHLSRESVPEQSHVKQENVSELENVSEQSNFEQDSVSNFEQDKVSEASQHEDVHERPQSHQPDVSPLKKGTAFEQSQLHRESSPEQPGPQQETTTHGQSETKQENVCEPTSPTKAKLDQSRMLQDFVSEQFQSHVDTKLERSWLELYGAHEQAELKQESMPEAPRPLQETVPVVTATAEDLVDSVLHDVSDDNDPNHDSLVIAEQSTKPKSKPVAQKLQKKRLQRKGNAVVEEIQTVGTEPVSQSPEERLSKLFSSKRTAATVDAEVAWRGPGNEKGDAADSFGFGKDRLEVESPDKDATVIRASEQPSSGVGMATGEDVSEPTPTKSVEPEPLSPQAVEKFSSRGRKIITKDRDDEVTGPQKKGRGRKAAGSSDGGELETTPKLRRGRKTSGRLSVDADDDAGMESKPEELPETEDSEEQTTPSMEVTGKYRRSPRGRRSSRRVGAPPDKDNEEDEDKEDVVHTDSCTDETPTKGKRVRRPKTRSSAEAAPTPGYTRHRVLENSLSPRRKSLETISTSPKDITKPGVKSEKSIATDISLKGEEKHKTKADAFGKPTKVEHDLYDFVEDDEEENALTHISLQTHRKLFSAADAARKSAHEDVSADVSALGKAGPTAAIKEHAPEHPTRPEPIEPVAGASQKKVSPVADHVTPAVKPRQECAIVPKEEAATTPGHSPDGVYEAKSIATKKQQHAIAETHLPLKLEMKPHQVDFGVKPETHKLTEEVVEQLPCRRASDGSTISVADIWSNMDAVINEVARGNFERGDSYDFYSKKPRSCSEDTRPMPSYAPQPPQRPQQQLKPVCYGPMSQIPPVMMAQPPSKAAAMAGLPVPDAQHPGIQKHAGKHATTSTFSSKYLY